MAILEQYGISVAGFDGLRSDSYEKHIAQRSLDELERLYEVLFGGPARGYAEIISECPTWGENNKPPHRSTLQAIRQRIVAEQSMRERMSVDSFVADEGKVQNPRSKVPSPGTAEYFESAVRVLSRELLSAKLDGQPIMENLRTFDRLLRMGSLRVRERRETREEARFAWERGGREIEKKPEPPNPAYKAVRLNKAEREVLESLRVMCLTERIYGRDTEEHRQDDLKKMVDRMKTCVEQDPTIKRVPSKSTKAGTNGHRGTEGTEKKAETKTEVSGSRVQPANKRRDANQRDAGPKQAKAETNDERKAETESEPHPASAKASTFAEATADRGTHGDTEENPKPEPVIGGDDRPINGSDPASTPAETMGPDEAQPAPAPVATSVATESEDEQLRRLRREKEQHAQLVARKAAAIKREEAARAANPYRAW